MNGERYRSDHSLQARRPSRGILKDRRPSMDVSYCVNVPAHLYLYINDRTMIFI